MILESVKLHYLYRVTEFQETFTISKHLHIYIGHPYRGMLVNEPLPVQRSANRDSGLIVVKLLV